MNVEQLLTVLVAGAVGHGTARALLPWRLPSAPERLVRINVSGERVPAVLGDPLVLGSLVALAALAAAAGAGWEAAGTGETGVAVAGVSIVMWIAGALDDRRGDESSRGFAGHLSALRRGRVTGGILKIVAGGLAGAIAGVSVFGGDLSAVAVTVLLVALGANTINLFDRAPGRAGKVALLIATPLIAFGDRDWAMAAAGTIGALLVCLPADLDERAMLGDAGANPLGAVIGLGLALSLDDVFGWVAVAALVAINLASERWSFSAAIEARPWLNRLDRMGRK